MIKDFVCEQCGLRFQITSCVTWIYEPCDLDDIDEERMYCPYCGEKLKEEK